jgi:hypothetical protein
MVKMAPWIEVLFVVVAVAVSCEEIAAQRARMNLHLLAPMEVSQPKRVAPHPFVMMALVPCAPTGMLPSEALVAEVAEVVPDGLGVRMSPGLHAPMEVNQPRLVVHPQYAMTAPTPYALTAALP